MKMMTPATKAGLVIAGAILAISLVKRFEPTTAALRAPTTPNQDKGQRYVAQITIINHGGSVSFQGATNLADSESILFTLKGRGYSGQANATVTGGQFGTETFTNRGSSLPPGAYSLQLNVFNPRTGLMIEGQQDLTLFTTKTVSVSFKPVKLGE